MEMGFGDYIPAGLLANEVGDKRYELGNHLSNVLQTVSDVKMAEPGVATVYQNDFSQHMDGMIAPWAPHTSIQLDNGRLKVTTYVQYAHTKLTYETEPGEVYRVWFTADLAGQGAITSIAYDPATSTHISHHPVFSNGTYYMDFLARSSNTLIAIESAVGGTRIFYLDDVKLEKRMAVYANDLTGNHQGVQSYGSGVSLSNDDNRLKVANMGILDGVKWVFPTKEGRSYRIAYTINLAGGPDVNRIIRDNETSSTLSFTESVNTRATFLDFTATGSETVFSIENLTVGPRDFYLSYVYIQDLHAEDQFYYTADVKSYSDYYPFGMQMPGRHGSEGEYRYGYQSSECDDEIKGSGNSYTTHFRQLDPRLGRWLSIDPKTKQLPWQSPYCSMDNNPVKFNDPRGDIIPLIWAIGEGDFYLITAVIVVDAVEEVWDNRGELTTSTRAADNRNAKGFQRTGGGAGNPFAPGGGNGSKLAKWVVGTGLAATAIDKLTKPFRDAQSSGKLEEKDPSSMANEAEGEIKLTYGRNFSYAEPTITVTAELFYTVKKGDNLSVIADTYKTTVDDLMKWNKDIKDPNKIFSDQKIKVGESSIRTNVPKSVIE